MKYKGTDFNIWDAWYLNDRERIHAFHLKLQSTPGNVGHVYTDDLLHFHKCEDILPPLGESEPDDALDKFTGCAYTDPKTGRHYIYYTMRDKNGSQKIGAAWSDDLEVFTRCTENPLLQPDPKIFDVPDKPANVDCRDMLVVYDEKSQRYYGYFATMFRNEKGERRGGTGVAESRDLIHWENQSIAFSPEFNGVVEAHDVFYMNGKWYLTMHTGNHYGAKGAVDDNNLITFTLYAVADEPRGPFRMQKDRVFIGSHYKGGFTCRTVMFHGTRYVLYIERSEYGTAISLPKQVKIIDNKLCPCYTPLLEKIRTGKSIGITNEAQLTDCDATFAWKTQSRDVEVSGDTVILRTGEMEYQHYLLTDTQYASCEVVCTITGNCREGGIQLAVHDEQGIAERYFVTADYAQNELCVSKSHGNLDPHYVYHCKRKFTFERGRAYHLRVIAQEGQFEVYIDDVLILQGAMKTEQMITPGLICGSGEFRVRGFVAYELEK